MDNVALIRPAWITAVESVAAYVWRIRRRSPPKGPVGVPTLRLVGGVAAALACQAVLFAEPVTVRHTEGLVHGFLALRTLDGAPLADGDLLQTADGMRVTTRVVFRFRDGSLNEETAVFSQRQQIRLISDHVVQHGPSFPQPIDMTIDAVAGEVAVRYTDDRGRSRVDTRHLDMPPDLANGCILAMLKNANPAAPPRSLGYVAATPKPQLVKLAISEAGEESFTTGGIARKAVHYVLKVDVGGIKGLLAPLVGRQPPDLHVWILGGEAPAFIKSEQPLYPNGPVWRIELVSPEWPGRQ